MAGQTLQGDYRLQGTFNSSVGSIGPLTISGDPTQVNFVSDTVDSQTQQVLQIGAAMANPNAGVQSQTNPFVNPANYSAVLLASFQIAPTNTGITKVFDFKNLSSDAGLYVNDATGLFSFYDGGAMIQGVSTTAAATGQYLQLVLTRDSSTNLVALYANGVAQFSFTDTTGLAVLGDATSTGNAFLTLFRDDGQGIGSTTLDESTRGNIARLRLYDGVLSAAQVAGLDRTAPVPEPASWALLALGFIAVLRLEKRRRRV